MIVHFPLGVLVSLCYGVSVVHCDARAENEHSGYVDRVDPALIEKLARRIDGLERQVEKQAEVNRQQSETNRQQAVVIGQLQHKLGVVEAELTTLKSSQAVASDAPEDKNTDDLPTNRDVNKHPSRRALMGSEGVAFTAYIDHNLAHLGINHPLVYNKVLLNEGGAYNNHTGVFTCPYEGIYVFNFMLAARDVQQIVAKLVVDSINMVDGIADTFHTNHEAQGGNYVTLSLKAGQSVWIANYRYADMGDYSNNAYRFSTFSGHLLSRNDGDVLAIQG